ncbi:Rrf2 family protein [Wenyingzhuangia heitensis]|uniref:Rrf2 family protein n=1 Tax=Wenyingzhuangia heitensis TaxID=1487859 RepID=A0ABX0UBJ7_9FLAO|nr:Rrf2 family transcriptional regulator [Wenyingzhuangia heitensis]NIJ44536.1 Rrf2 family protein [Wenyingzhuangia heitensis]
MLSKACKYAIRAILFLAINSNKDKKIGIKKIAEELQTPQPFLAKLLQQLSTHKLVSSTKGPGGGFYLSEKDLQIKLWDIVVNIDGTDKFDQCFLGLSLCSDKYPCPVHHIVKPFKNEILVDFRQKTIEQLKGEIETEGTLLSLKLLEK